MGDCEFYQHSCTVPMLEALSTHPKYSMATALLDERMPKPAESQVSPPHCGFTMFAATTNFAISCLATDNHHRWVIRINTA